MKHRIAATAVCLLSVYLFTSLGYAQPRNLPAALKSDMQNSESNCQLSDAESMTLPLTRSCWSTLSPYGGSAAITESDGALRFYGSGTRQGTQAFMKTPLDLRRATLYIKWRAHSPSGSYAAWGVGVGSIPGQSDTSIGGIATAGWTPSRHGAGFTTKNAWNSSSVITDDTWYYTRLKISCDKSVIAVTATGNYDDAGGSLFYSCGYLLDDGEYGELSSAVVFGHVNDNYGGTETWMEIGEAAITKTCTNLCLDITYNLTQFTMAWTALANATGYTIYYAYSDYKREVDMSTFGTVDMGTQTQFSGSLPSGTSVYLAIVASTPAGDVTSNIELLAPYGGTVSFPDTGSALAQLNDSSGIGTAVFTGTQGSGGPEGPLVSGSFWPANSDPYTVSWDEDGNITSLTRGSIRIDFATETDDTYSFSYYDNETLVYSSSGISAQAWPALKASPLDGSSYNCSQRDVYEASLDSREDITDLKEDLKAMIMFFEMVLKNVIEGDSDSRYENALHFMFYRAWGGLVRVASTIDSIKSDLMAEFDRNCHDDGDEGDCGPWTWTNDDKNYMVNYSGFSILREDQMVRWAVSYEDREVYAYIHTLPDIETAEETKESFLNGYTSSTGWTKLETYGTADIFYREDANGARYQYAVISNTCYRGYHVLGVVTKQVSDATAVPLDFHRELFDKLTETVDSKCNAQ